MMTSAQNCSSCHPKFSLSTHYRFYAVEISTVRLPITHSKETNVEEREGGKRTNDTTSTCHIISLLSLLLARESTRSGLLDLLLFDSKHRVVTQTTISYSIVWIVPHSKKEKKSPLSLYLPPSLSPLWGVCLFSLGT
jgi:hypothetical protein